MSDSLSLGPLAVPLAPLLLALAAWLGLLAGAWAGRRADRRAGRTPPNDPEGALLRMLLVAVLAARLGHVWMWRSAYAAQPWSLIDLRDGGFDPAFGAAGAALWGLATVRRHPALRPALLAGYLSTLTLWIAGTVALALRDAPGQPLPPLALASVAEAGSVDLRRYAGQPVVLNLWATWCPPCRREMPVLARAQRARRDVHVVFVNQGEDAAAVRGFLAAQGLALQEVLLDPGRQVGAAFQASALPTTLFFDREGRLVARRIGALSEATLAEQLERPELQDRVPNGQAR